MLKPSSPLVGCNTNVRHRGRVFHIQTEDSGARYAHVMTHLFMDGGRILKSVKASYSEYLDHPQLSDVVGELMKRQHKAMFMSLRDGAFDAQLDPSAAVSEAGRPCELTSSDPAPATLDDAGLDFERATDVDREAPFFRTSELPPPPPNLFCDQSAMAVASAKPRPMPRPFGAELITDRSLDEVILDYLAETKSSG